MIFISVLSLSLSPNKLGNSIFSPSYHLFLSAMAHSLLLEISVRKGCIWEFEAGVEEYDWEIPVYHGEIWAPRHRSIRRPRAQASGKSNGERQQREYLLDTGPDNCRESDTNLYLRIKQKRARSSDKSCTILCDQWPISPSLSMNL
jgi:hypothetical protein